MEIKKFIFSKGETKMKQNRQMLEKEIFNLLQKLKSLDPTTDNYEMVQTRLETLYKLRIEEDKSKEQINAIIDRRLQICVGVVGIVLPLMFYSKWMSAGFEFEKEGVYTSTTFRNLFGGFKPKM